MAKAEEYHPGSTSVAYQNMEPFWPLLDDLMAGTDAMRANAATWLPKETAEATTDYAIRVNRSFLYGAYKDTIDKNAARPFAKPVTVMSDLEDEAVPTWVDNVINNADGAGRDLTQIAKYIFSTGMDLGLCHVLIDMPVGVDGETRSVADEEKPQNAPRFVTINPKDLLGFETEVDPETGGDILTEVRIQEKRRDKNGEFGQIENTYVREIKMNEWILWKQIDPTKPAQSLSDWEIESQGVISPPRPVPLLTLFFEQVNFLEARPPLLRLATLNLAHFQSSSDYRNILRYSSYALLFAKGFSNKEIKTGIVVGPSAIIKTTNENAQLSYVEHTGAALGSAEHNLKHLEEEMEIMGLQMHQNQTGDAKATGQAIGESKSISQLHSWTNDLEKILNECFELASTISKYKLPQGFAVNVFNDFVVGLRTSEDMTQLQKMRMNNDITQSTLLSESKRRGVFAENFDVEAEVNATEIEAPDLSGTGITGGDLIEDDE